MSTCAATYGKVQCGASAMTGSGIQGAIAQPTRWYPGNKWVRGANYGRSYPTTEAAFAAMLESGHSCEHRPLRETRLFYFGALRRSWRKAIRRGNMPSTSMWFQYVIKHDFFLKGYKTLAAFKKDVAHNAEPEQLRFSNQAAWLWLHGNKAA